ncbi:MAG: Hpt domain-containing protein, partial [Fibromonadales bacterium]|nr:Hpt domain-containing protein [Fibromonadales bacterium]
AISHKDGTEKIEEIKKALKSENYPLYAIHVHALKGMFANIGANKLAEAASLLETAAKQKDSAFLISQTDNFLADLQTLLSNISKAVQAGKEKNQKDFADFEALKDELQKLKEAIDAFNPAVIDEAANNLQQWTQSSEAGANIERILRNVLLGEYEEARAEIAKATLHPKPL